MTCLMSKPIRLNQSRGSFNTSRNWYQFADSEMITGFVSTGHVEHCGESNPGSPDCESGELTTTISRPIVVQTVDQTAFGSALSWNRLSVFTRCLTSHICWSECKPREMTASLVMHGDAFQNPFSRRYSRWNMPFVLPSRTDYVQRCIQLMYRCVTSWRYSYRSPYLPNEEAIFTFKWDWLLCYSIMLWWRCVIHATMRVVSK